LQAFAVNNPKLSAFLLSQLALTGFPLFLFIAFTLTVFIFALIASLLIAVLVAVVFTVGAVLFALVILLPTIFFTTFAASFLFLWGLGGYYILQWANKGEFPAPEGKAIGDKINGWTGGRLGWLMEGARGAPQANGKGGDEKKPLMSDHDGQHQEKDKRHPAKLARDGAKGVQDGVQGGVGEARKQVDNATGGVTKKLPVDASPNGVGSPVKQVNGVKNKATGALGGVKGAVGGTTGLL